jgi:hypothetical protein
MKSEYTTSRTSARVLHGIDAARPRDRLVAYPGRPLPGPGALRSPTRAALPISDLARRSQGRRSRRPWRCSNARTQISMGSEHIWAESM